MKNFSNVVIGGFCLAIIGVVLWLYAGRFAEQRQEARFYEAAALPAPVIRQETPEEKLAGFRLGADAAAVQFVTNQVVGFRRIIFCSTQTWDPAVSNWTGLAEAEFINRLGGVERQFVRFRFAASDGSLFATRDWKADQEAWEASMARALSGLK